MVPRPPHSCASRDSTLRVRSEDTPPLTLIWQARDSPPTILGRDHSLGWKSRPYTTPSNAGWCRFFSAASPGSRFADLSGIFVDNASPPKGALCTSLDISPNDEGRAVNIGPPLPGARISGAHPTTSHIAWIAVTSVLSVSNEDSPSPARDVRSEQRVTR